MLAPKDINNSLDLRKQAEMLLGCGLGKDNNIGNHILFKKTKILVANRRSGLI